MVDQPSFGDDILPLFRPSDIGAMSFAFNLADYEDVCDNAENIYDRIADGTMPCDMPWDEDQLELLRRWIDTGMSP